MNKYHNISIIWDFDKTLTPMDSTTELIKVFLRDSPIENFWKEVKIISETKSDKPMDSVSTSDAPVWMYLLSELANDHIIQIRCQQIAKRYEAHKA